MLDLADPDTFVGGVPHEELAELRAAQPVYFQLDPDGARPFCCATPT